MCVSLYVYRDEASKRQWLRRRQQVNRLHGTKRLIRTNALTKFRRMFYDLQSVDPDTTVINVAHRLQDHP